MTIKYVTTLSVSELNRVVREINTHLDALSQSSVSPSVVTSQPVAIQQIRSAGLTPSVQNIVNAMPAGVTSIDHGGTGQTTQQGAINALTAFSGILTSGEYLKSGVSGVSFSFIAATDISGVLPITLGGTSSNTRQGAINVLTAVSGVVTSGQFLRCNGANVVFSPVNNGDLPTNPSFQGITTNSIITGSLWINGEAGTGANTATFIATNKPGVGATAPATWLSLILDGVTYYIPCWL